MLQPFTVFFNNYLYSQCNINCMQIFVIHYCSGYNDKKYICLCSTQLSIQLGEQKANISGEIKDLKRLQQTIPSCHPVHRGPAQYLSFKLRFLVLLGLKFSLFHMVGTDAGCVHSYKIDIFQWVGYFITIYYLSFVTVF